MSERVIKGYFLRVSDEGMQFKGYMAEFVDTLEYLQEYVDGYIDVLSLNDEIDLVINDEGKMHNLPTNRACIGDNGGVYDYICGNILCLRHDSDGNFDSILESDIPLIEKKLIPLMSVDTVEDRIIYTMINARVCQSMRRSVEMTDIERYRRLYPKGSKLELLSDLDDPYTPKLAGDIFTVDMVDDAGNIHGSWASGGSLSLIIGVDNFRLVR